MSWKTAAVYSIVQVTSTVDYTSSLVEKIAYFKPFQIFMSCNADSLFNANTWLYSFHCCFYCFIMFLKLLSFLFQEFIIHSNKEN